MNCKRCGRPLEIKPGRGGARTFCDDDACRRERKRAADRRRYEATKDLRLAERRARYQANLERERDRSRRYYESHREESIERSKARYRHLKGEGQ